MHDLLGSGTRNPRAGDSENVDRKTIATVRARLRLVVLMARRTSFTVSVVSRVLLIPKFFAVACLSGTGLQVMYESCA